MGPSAGLEMLVDGELVIGRNEAGQGNLGNDAEISRRHARFRRLDSGGVEIEDLGSTNGTFVNGQPVRRVELQNGTRVTLGRTTLVFRRD
jgi:pSer/pThr/pTyr-binding forkhead associated (FHA) protein